MDLVDDQGFLFGKINVIDALAILLVGAVIVAGVVLVLTPSQPAQEPQSSTQVISFKSDPVPDFVVDSIQEGPVPTEDVIAVKNKSVSRENESFVVHLKLKIPVSTADSGLPMYRGERLYIGKRMSVDLGSTIIEGVVVEMQPIQRPSS